MALESQQQGSSRTDRAETSDMAVIASAASVLLSWYYFFGRGRRDMGVFVGLWPPTILAFASYFKQREMEESVKQLPGSGLMDRMEKMMQK